MAKLIKLLTTTRKQITSREYLQHIEQSQYHAPAYLAFLRHMSFSNI